jgi:16S rRNA processing protein RimM
VNDFYLIAKIKKVVGNEGFVLIESYSDFPERFYELETVYLDFWGDKKLFIVEEVKEHKSRFLLKFEKFDDERSATVLEGREIFVEEKDVVELPDNTFFVHDLINCLVLQEENKLGIIKDVLQLPANDVLVIEDTNKEEKLLPFVLDFIESFDPEKKILRFKKGLDLGYGNED